MKPRPERSSVDAASKVSRGRSVQAEGRATTELGECGDHAGTAEPLGRMDQSRQTERRRSETHGDVMEVLRFRNTSN